MATTEDLKLEENVHEVYLEVHLLRHQTIVDPFVAIQIAMKIQMMKKKVYFEYSHGGMFYSNMYNYPNSYSVKSKST